MQPASTDHSHGLRFILADGTIDWPQVRVVARTRAVTHARKYGDDDLALAYRCERRGVVAEAKSQRDIWQMRAGVGLVAIQADPGEYADTFEAWSEQQPWHTRNRSFASDVVIGATIGEAA